MAEADDAVKSKKTASEIDARLESMEITMSDLTLRLGERLDTLEKLCGAAANPPPQRPDIEPKKFAEIVKQTLKEVKDSNFTINERDQTKTIEHQNVLVIKPKPGTEMAGDGTINGNEIEEAMEKIQVSSCRKTKSGGLVVKFPNREAMSEASLALETRLGPSHAVQVTEPKKMLPKMTVPDVSHSLADEEIIPAILNKNPNIQKLSEKGYDLSLLFTIKKDHSKTAVLKMAPEIRSEIIKNGNYIYIGLKRCKAYDRFWVSQCYHCQGF